MHIILVCIIYLLNFMLLLQYYESLLNHVYSIVALKCMGIKALKCMGKSEYISHKYEGDQV